MSKLKVTILTLFAKACNFTCTADRGQDLRKECHIILLAQLNHELSLNILVDIILAHLPQIVYQYEQIQHIVKQTYNGIDVSIHIVNPQHSDIHFSPVYFNQENTQSLKCIFWCETLKLSVYKVRDASDGHFKSGGFLRILLPHSLRRQL